MPVLNFVALTGNGLLYYKGDWVAILQQKHKWFYHHQGNGFYDHFDQRPDWKLIPSGRVPSWWPMGNDLMTSSPEVPQSHGQKCISSNTLWFIRCSRVSGNTLCGAQISCHLLYTKQNKALYLAREQIHHEQQWWKPFQAGCQCASVLLWSTYLCFNISMSKTHTCTWIVPDFFCPNLSSRLDAFTSCHFTVQLHFYVSGDKSL